MLRSVLLLFLLGLTAMGNAQSLLDERYSISFTDASLPSCLAAIEEAANISFSYNARQMQSVELSASHSFTNERLEEILNFLLEPTSFDYAAIGNRQITLFIPAPGSKKVVLSGHIRESDSEEDIISAQVYFPELEIGCVTNNYGFYSIEVPDGEWLCRFSYIGRVVRYDTLLMKQNTLLDVYLKADTFSLSTFVVVDSALEAERRTPWLETPTLKGTELGLQHMEQLPMSAGEKDVLKYLQQTPGVQPGNDGTATLQVRGSGKGNNLILIDEMPIYHPTHMLGLFSVFNADAVKAVTLYKDFIPLNFGARNASVVHVHTREGNMLKHHLSGGLSTNNVRLNVEGPIVKERASFYAGIRQSLTAPFIDNFLSERSLQLPSFTDINAKVNVILNPKNRVYATIYFGLDNLNDSLNSYNWGNNAGSLRWNRIVDAKTFTNLSVSHSAFSYGFEALQGNEGSFQQIVATDQVKYDWNHYYNNTTTFHAGFSTSWVRTQKKAPSNTSNLFLQRSAFENGLYASVEKELSSKLSLNAGLRIPIYFHLGTQDTTAFLNSDLSKTTVIYEKNKLYDFIVTADPRFLLVYQLSPKNEISFATSSVTQHTHSIAYVNYFLPIDIWTTSNNFLKPEQNFQQSLGWKHTEKSWQTSVSIYNKFVKNTIDYATPQYTASTDIESNLLSGNLHVVGAEAMLQYHYGNRYAATLMYTFTRSRQKIDGINNNLPYIASFDRPHYLAVSQLYTFNEKWKMGLNYTWHSGAATTLPNGQFVIEGNAFPLYSEERNAERLPVFSRLDVSFTRQLGLKRKKRFHLVITITNLLNRYNSSIVYIAPNTVGTSQLQLQSYDYTPLTLSLSLNFRF